MIRRFLNYLQYERRYSMRTVGEYGDDLRAFSAFLGLDESAFEPSKPDTTDVKTWMVASLPVQLSAACRRFARSTSTCLDRDWFGVI